MVLSDHSRFLAQNVPALLTWHFTDYTYHTSVDTLAMSSADEMENVGITTLAAALMMANATDQHEEVAMELAMRMLYAALERMTKDEAVGFLQKRYGDQAEDIVESYAMNFPDAKPVELVDLILSNRSRVVAAAEAKKHQTSPVYVAWFGWCPPLFDGRMRAFHCLDICFWFLNTDRMVTHTGGGERPRKLSKMMAEALLQFARTGDPNGGSLPKWDEFSVEKGETMILNDTCEMALDPDRQARHALPQS